MEDRGFRSGSRFNWSCVKYNVFIRAPARREVDGYCFFFLRSTQARLVAGVVCFLVGWGGGTVGLGLVVGGGVLVVGGGVGVVVWDMVVVVAATVAADGILGPGGGTVKRSRSLSTLAKKSCKTRGAASRLVAEMVMAMGLKRRFE